MVLIDGGLELHGYVSDITCCFPVSGQFNSHQKALYEALLFVHQKLLEYANNLDKVRHFLKFIEAIFQKFS